MSEPMAEQDAISPAFAPPFEARRPSRVRRVLRVARQNPLGTFGLLLTATLVVVGVFSPVLAPYPADQFVGIPGQGPSRDFPLGTDKFGRDMFSHVIYGARISLQVGFMAVGIGTVAGLLIGAWSGFRGGVVDVVVQRAVDTAIAFPQLLFLLVLVRVLGPSMQNVILAIAILIIPSVARIVRSAALTERNNLYILAARSVGARDTRILIRHIIPNVAPIAIVISTTLLGSAILAEASLSFLGLGIPQPNPSWGADISLARGSYPINVSAALFPGIAISLAVLGFNLAGDALRDIFDPRLRGR